MLTDPELLRGAARHTAALPGLNPLPDNVPILCLSEDEAFAKQELLPALASEGFHVELRNSPDRLPEIAPSYAIVVLSIASANAQGYKLCARLHQLNLPLMLVLCGATRADLLKGYEAGADGCILAPFDPRELLVRLRALLRRLPIAH